MFFQNKGGLIMRKIVLALLCVIVFAVPAFSQMMDKPMMDKGNAHSHMMGMDDKDMMGDHIGMCLDNAEKIGLSDDQINKLTPIHREMKKKQVKFKADLQIAEMEHMEIMEVKDFDLEKANASVRKIGDMKIAHHLEMLKSMKEVRSILTAEQFQKMKKMMPMNKGAKKPVKDRKHIH
jgi:Spy/CpxP family protein refolding chaperone